MQESWKAFYGDVDKKEKIKNESHEGNENLIAEAKHHWKNNVHNVSEKIREDKNESGL